MSEAMERAFEREMPIHAKDIDPRTGQLFRESAFAKRDFEAGWRARGEADAAALPSPTIGNASLSGSARTAAWNTCLSQCEERIRALDAAEAGEERIRHREERGT